MNAIHAGWMEKRQSERVDATVKVSYILIPKADLVATLANPAYRDSTTDRLPDLSKRSPTLHAVTRDMSLSGMSLVGQTDFPDDHALEINIYLPTYPAPLTVIAEVVRSHEEGSGERAVHRAGIKILAINRQDLSRLDRFLLAEKMKKQEKL
jgi:c-di-GMP-binding flagellar brake protein YcgR